MSSRNLPPECLRMIFSELAEDHDARSLAKLLLVSKDIQALALPLLYEDPFRFFGHPFAHKTNHPTMMDGSCSGSEINLARLLLRCVTDVELLMESALAHYMFDSMMPPMINYLSYLKHLHLRTGKVAISGQQIPWRAVDSATWALCSERAEHLKSITVDAHCILRYQPIVHRLTSLAQIHTQELTPPSPRITFQRALDDVTLFIQTHMTTIGTLKDVFYPECPSLQQESFWRSLPLMDKPRIVDYMNWDRFYATVHQVDVSFVRSIRYPSSFTDNHRKEYMQRMTPYLSRCRSLETYDVPFLGVETDSFRFAAEEKDSAGYSREAPNRAPLGDDHQAHQDGQDKPRMMLKHFRTSSSRLYIIPWLDEVMYGFSESLESIQILMATLNSAVFVPAGMNFHSIPKVFGEHWSLTSLRRLELHNDHRILTINTKFLSDSPLLEVLILMDFVYGIKRRVKDQEPFKLPKLKDLQIGGRVALTLHPESLRNSPQLESLSLAYHDKEESRISWSWDWILPRLTGLTLFGQFAVDFCLSALQLMPQLRKLFLMVDERSYSDGSHQRHRFDLAAFTVPGTPHSFDTESGTPITMRLPLLENLHLGGGWWTDNHALREVFSKVMPNLKRVSQLTGSINPTEWIQASSVLENLCYVRSTYDLRETWSFPPSYWNGLLDGWTQKQGSSWPEAHHQSQQPNTIRYEIRGVCGSTGTFDVSRGDTTEDTMIRIRSFFE